MKGPMVTTCNLLTALEHHRVQTEEGSISQTFVQDDLSGNSLSEGEPN
jgi:hypothetical protein